MLKGRVVGGLALLVVGVALPAAAQDATIGFDAAFNSAYNWRGLSLTNKPVIQPDVWLSALGFTGGVWANVEPTKYDGATDLSESGGVRSGIAEIDYWIEYARTTGNVSWKAGWVAYTYNKNNAGINNLFNTSEVYGNVSIGGLPVTPALGIWYDIDNVKGAFIQPSLSLPVKVAPTFTVNLTAMAGISAGQEVNTSNLNEGANFAKSGLAHADLGASTSFTAGPVSFAPQLHIQWCHDDFVKTSSVGHQHSVKFWGGVTLSWSHGFGATKSE
jgi:uncharacterized protein (TIGR02001 family)